jgi:hypothetical protein
LPLVPGHAITRSSDTVRRLSDIEAAYLAGIVDGEGNIHIAKPGKRSVRVSVANTSAELIDWLRGIGGYVTTNRRCFPATRKSQKIVFCWAVHAWTTNFDLLSQIVPHMIIKKAKAEDALALLDTWKGQPRKARKTHCSRGHAMTDETTYLDRDGARVCVECAKRRSEVYRHRRHLLRASESNPSSN